MLEPKIGSPIWDCQPSPEDCCARDLTEGDYRFQLADNLRVMEDRQDREGAGRLWSSHGRRSCTQALHILEVHWDTMTAPRGDTIPAPDGGTDE